MRTPIWMAATLPLVVLTACGSSRPTEAEIEDAKAKAALALAAADSARGALEVLGLMPVYTCGEPRRTFVGNAIENARVRAACATFASEGSGDADQVTVTFADGCTLGDDAMKGSATFKYSGGEDRLELEADLSNLSINGFSQVARAGYGTCGDEKRVFAATEGRLPKDPAVSYRVDASVALREGLPLVGGETLVLNGPAQLTSAEGTDEVALESLVYNVGEYLPESGTVRIHSARGTSLQISFSKQLWRLGKAEVTIDGSDPVTIPIAH